VNANRVQHIVIDIMPQVPIQSFLSRPNRVSFSHLLQEFLEIFLNEFIDFITVPPPLSALTHMLL